MTSNDSSHPQSSSIEGTWSVTIHGPTGPQETSLELKSVDGVLGGTQSSLGQVEAINEITYDSSSGDIYWLNKIKKPLPLSLKFQGSVEGNTMSGKVTAGIMGSFSFTGKKL
jgi:hypothetical protein